MDKDECIRCNILIKKSDYCELYSALTLLTATSRAEFLRRHAALGLQAWNSLSISNAGGHTASQQKSESERDNQNKKVVGDTSKHGKSTANNKVKANKSKSKSKSNLASNQENATSSDQVGSEQGGAISIPQHDEEHPVDNSSGEDAVIVNDLDSFKSNMFS